MKRYLIYIVSVMSFMSCSKDVDFSKSVMIYDKELTDLPAYSEWGYNTFGVYYDREVLISNDKEVPLKVIVTNNQTSFVFTGQKGSYSYYNFYYHPMTLSLTLTDYVPTVYSDLLVLHDSTINLNSKNCKVELSIDDTNNIPVKVIDGQFYFKRIQKVKVDKKSQELILSGYFDFKALVNGKPITFSNGRFDLGLANANFYKY